jgi:class 3 adenylate cyclase/putative methionine-R-sulfoxide reductase with GAF domain
MLTLDKLEKDYYTPEHAHMAQAFATQAATAIENARLFDETQRLLKVTEERAAELGAISKVSQALIVESELENTIQLIGDQMREIFSADIVYVALLDPQADLIHFPYQVGENFTTLKFGEGLASKIIETGEPLLFDRDVTARTLEIGVKPAGKEALSYLGVPIKTSKGTIGVISVQSTQQEGLFNDDSQRLLTTIAANAGAALHNAQLFSDALENLRQVEILTNAANAINNSNYEPEMVESVAARADALGELARVFANMAEEVRLREQRLKRQLAQLQLDIEEKKLAKEETVATYIAMDRRQAMANHLSLPERVRGTALFADVSGFTTLTESLANELGLQRGAEEMIRHLNRVFTVLIDEVHRYSGAVINFSGDAITCWFDDLDLHGNPRADSSVERAATCAFSMQKEMTQFAAITTPNGKTIALTVKIALAAGPTRRMAVGGDARSHQIDVLAGATLTTLSSAEHESERGEIVLATANIPSVAEKFNVAEWRKEKQFAVLTGLKNEVSPSPWAELGGDAIIKSRLRPWMHPTVFEKVRAGQSDMLSELRPATALFMKFDGLDYDNDPEADKKLNDFIKWVEGVIAPHNGSIIQFTVGDKGSYVYIVFGAPIAHHDDATQAVFTALELASPPESLSYMTDLFIGLASGQMRVGAYGGAGHRTYGAIGDRTNLAARLMVAASGSSVDNPEGQRAVIFCNDSVYEAAQTQVVFESMPPIQVKGKTDTVAIYRPLRKLSTKIATSTVNATELSHRIDRLTPAEQLTLKVASVIGQTFSLEPLSAIFPEEHTSDEILTHLQTLLQLDLIRKNAQESSSYGFIDQPTHKAAYTLMLFAQRRQLHRAMAEWLDQDGSSLPQYAEIARHWRAAEEIPKAIEYFEKAGEYAREKGDYEEATHFFNQSLALGS